MIRLFFSFSAPLHRLYSLFYAHLRATPSRLYHVHPFFFHVLHFLALSLLGAVALLLLDSRHPHNFLDLFFMSVSSCTVSGLNTVELESFSIPQLVVLTLLMLAGGEVFVSLLALFFRTRQPTIREPVRIETLDPESTADLNTTTDLTVAIRRRCISALSNVVLAYFLTFHILGFAAVAFFLRYTPSSRGVLQAKKLPLLPFAISVTVSSFANGGIIPTNENMAIFVRNSGLLLVTVVLILVGNTMFTALLRTVIYFLYRTTRREEYCHLLKNPENLSFVHLKSNNKTLLLAASAVALWALQLSVFLAMEWNSLHLHHLTPFQKFVTGVFQSTNSRHCGESSIDISHVSPAMATIYLLAMFLPAHASLQLPPKKGTGVRGARKEPERRFWKWLEIASMPQALYVAIFVFLICLIERKNMSNDPSNNSFLFVVFEVVSAYGNVGFSTGYACSRQSHANSSCRDLSISLTGKWSNAGKLMVIFIMLFGRIKKFHSDGGKSWMLQLSS